MKVMSKDVNQTQKQTFYFSWTPIKTGRRQLDHQAEDRRREDGHRHRRQQDHLRLDQGQGRANNPLARLLQGPGRLRVHPDPQHQDMKVTKIEGRDEFLKKLVSGQPADEAAARADPQRGRPEADGRPDLRRRARTRKSRRATPGRRESKLDMGPIGKYENTTTTPTRARRQGQEAGQDQGRDDAEVHAARTTRPGTAACRSRSRAPT